MTAAQSPELITSGPNQGLPKLQSDARVTSFFEFWPVWVMYLPVIMYVPWLMVRFRSLTAPLWANPRVLLGGMVGESKTEILDQANGLAEKHVLPYVCISAGSDVSGAERLDQCIAAMEKQSISFPCVAKPDLGCRGAGVQVVSGKDQLAQYLGVFPTDRDLILQTLSQFKAEAGVFYVREPGHTHGKVVSITLKYRPTVYGDGKNTLGELVKMDSRAGKMEGVYRSRLSAKWNDIIPAGEEFPLVFAGSHCRGSVFKDGCEYITPQLNDVIDEVVRGFPEFYFGRLDVKTESLVKLMQGESFDIIEINGASSELTHIWDSKTSLRAAISALLWQYRTLFRIGSKVQRDDRLRPSDDDARRASKRIPKPSVSLLIETWLKELREAKRYPSTH